MNELIKALGNIPHWVCWKKIRIGTDEKTGEPKFTKIPYVADTSNRNASSTDQDTWRSYQEAREAVSGGRFSGIGFALSASIPFVVIDLDHCIDKATGEIQGLAADIINMIGETYIEVSPSGEGLHIWGIMPGDLPGEKPGIHKNGIEIYRDNRYMTVTENPMKGYDLPLVDISKAVYDIVDTYKLIDQESKEEGKKIATSKKILGVPVTLDDDFLIQKIRTSKQGQKFIDLFDHGDISGQNNDKSKADESLLSILAYWTNGNAAQMERIFLRSKLAETLDRKKHRNNGYLRKYSIPKALDFWEEKGCSHYEPQNMISIPRPSDGVSESKHSSQEPESTAGMTTIVLNDELLTDSNLAELVTSQYGDRLKYCKDMKTWLAYNGQYWAPIDMEGAYKYVLLVLDGIKSEIVKALYQVQGDGERAKVLTSLFRKIIDRRNNGHLRDVVTVMKGIRPCMAVDFDKDPYFLNCTNGLLNLKTGELLPHSPSQMCMKCTKAAYTGPLHSSLWSNTVAAILPHEKKRHYMQKVLGYSICGDVEEHESYFLKGNGGNGKSLVMETVKAALGSYSVVIPIETLLSNGFDESGNTATPSIASLKGKRLAICGESELGRTLNTATFKKLTGGDTLTARGLYEKLISFTPSHHLFFTSNYDISLKDATDDGLKRRLKVIVFPVTFSKEAGNLDTSLYTKLRERKSQEEVLAWLVDGFKAYQVEGLKEPPQVKADTQGYYDENDAIGDFIREYCELGPEKRINRTDLYKDYCQYYQNECGHFPMAARSFFQVISKRPGISTLRSHGKRYLVGIARKLAPILN